MALQKMKTFINGESGNYWKITKISLDKKQMKINYTIELFKEMQYSNIAPLDYKKTFNFDISSNELDNDLFSLGYLKIKNYANTIKKPAIPYSAAVAEVPEIKDENDNVIQSYVHAKPEIQAQPETYMDEELHGAIDV